VSAALPAGVAGISILSHNGIAAAVVSRVVHMRKTGGRGVTARRVASLRLASPRLADVRKRHYNRREDFSSRSRSNEPRTRVRVFVRLCVRSYNERGITWPRPV